jgi:hypothetical protein
MLCCHRTTTSSSLAACISWACLLPQELSFAAVARLLGWHTYEAQVLSDTTIRTIVRTHGQIIRQAEQVEVAALLRHDDLSAADLLVMPHNQPRRRAGWPEELNAAVDAALAAQQVCPQMVFHGLIGIEFWRLAVDPKLSSAADQSAVYRERACGESQ